MTNYHNIKTRTRAFLRVKRNHLSVCTGLFLNKDTDIYSSSGSWLFNRCYVMSAPHGDLMAHDHTVHHDHDITWPYDQDMTITTRILPTQHLWWSTKISWIHSSRIFKFMNIWPEMHWDWWWFEIFTNGQVPAIFMARGCAGWVVWTRREWGWVIESYQGPSRLLLSCPDSLQHCSNTNLEPAESILWGDFRDIQRLHKLRLRFCILYPTLIDSALMPVSC